MSTITDILFFWNIDPATGQAPRQKRTRDYIDALHTAYNLIIWSNDYYYNVNYNRQQQRIQQLDRDERDAIENTIQNILNQIGN